MDPSSYALYRLLGLHYKYTPSFCGFRLRAVKIAVIIFLLLFVTVLKSKKKLGVMVLMTAQCRIGVSSVKL